MMGKTHVMTSGAIFTGGLLTSHMISSGLNGVNKWVKFVNDMVVVLFDITWPENVHTGGNFWSVLHVGLWSHLVVLMVACLFGSLLPDVDSSKSALGRFVPFVGKVIPHRTVTHTIWAVIFVGFMVMFLGGSPVGFALWLGYTLHIIEDSFSKQGIAWFYPISGYRVYGSGAVVKRGRKPKFFYYRTNSDREIGIYYVSAFCWLVWFIRLVFLVYGKQI